ncbi:helix-turn-helix transcriptional regulator [Brucella sp. BO2]|uniref:helix-turn-helix domain-containing protein n=1 Tax=Brucella sp. BO2 TaxID=693750 RepID=UPI0004A24E38|nr:helix-turn-helix transcriptional regulator [Brucella sp. BO2]QPN29021.1 helix-turn-helix transcriptional regulator [Brucella sp. BO2]
MINWSQSRLAEVAGIARATLTEFEAGKRAPIANNLAAIKTTLESAGIIFIEEDSEGPGVRLKKEK